MKFLTMSVFMCIYCAAEHADETAGGSWVCQHGQQSGVEQRDGGDTRTVNALTTGGVHSDRQTDVQLCCWQCISEWTAAWSYSCRLFIHAHGMERRYCGTGRLCVCTYTGNYTFRAISQKRLNLLLPNLVHSMTLRHLGLWLILGLEGQCHVARNWVPTASLNFIDIRQMVLQYVASHVT